MRISTPMATALLGSALASIGTVAAQQAQAPEEQEHQGIPATQHQEEALREVDSELFERLDANHDGSISRQEAESESALTEGWSEYDANSDQRLDQQELAAYEHRSASESGSESGSEDIEVAEGGPTVEGLPTSPHQREAVRGEVVELLDADRDGAISRSEAQGDSALTADWDRLDSNGDGKLDPSELAQHEE